MITRRILGHLVTSTILLVSILMTSCVPSAQNSSRSNTTENSTTTSGGTTTDPSFDDQNNFFQNGSTQTSNYLEIPLSFTDSFYFRGTGVNSYIKNYSAETPQCLVMAFPTTTTTNILVLAARPFNFTNFSTGTKEYYYLVEPSNTSNNKIFCQKAGLLSKISSLYPTRTVVYDFTTLCPGCLNSFFITNETHFMTEAGNTIDLVTMGGLGLKIQRVDSGTDSGIGGSCSLDSECTTQGYECCSSGQCVMNKEIKTGVDITSTDYLYAKAQIDLDANNIYNFPQFFHLCSNEPPATDDPADPSDAEYEATKRFLEMKELYDCTTPVRGELSICTLTYENASSPSLPRDFLTGVDDRKFTDTYTGTQTLQDHSLYEVSHGDEVIFSRSDLNQTASYNTSDLTIGVSPLFNGNDTLTDALQITLSHTLSSSSREDTLKIKYQIDGSCEQESTSYAICTKYYVQGQNDGYIDDHYPGSNNFNLPSYADTTRTIEVTVDDAPRELGLHYQIVAGAPSYIQFLGTGIQVYDNQNVKIKYYVNTALHPTLMTSKDAALQGIADRCNCPDKSCRLREIYTNISGVDTVTGYGCYTPQTEDNEIPTTQNVSVSAQNTPVRFFTVQGAPAEGPTYGDSNTVQEGNTFEYTDNNLLKPNNVSSYVGFNEIYGSITTNSGSALAAKEVDVEYNATYDIYVYSGTFSTCLYCGSDYYSTLTKIFPANFTGKGGGYTPNPTETDALSTSDYRADDLHFGRSCFVPASMIPWTHTTNSDRQSQRLNRLAAQHFLFANGYQRDWYGFDYGSLIGSWDGITWFSIGNQRRITSKSNKLYLAVNAYFGDLTIDSTYSVQVIKDANVGGAGSDIKTDYESDGAQCQQQHACNVDSDCAAKLGWDYVCADVATIQSKWANVDTNGLEIPGADTTLRLLNLGGTYSGPDKRCVYRGRGAPCATNYTANSASNTFNGTATPKLLGCASGHYCQVFNTGSMEAKFNTKIARYGKTVSDQNASSDVSESDLDTVGLGARILGRPYAFNGTEEAPATVYNNLAANNVYGICIPGKSPENDTLSNQQSATPSTDYNGDQVTGNGMALDTNIDLGAVSACANFDEDGEYLHLNTSYTGLMSNSTTVSQYAASQSISTNSTNILETILGDSSAITRNFTDEYITSKTLEPNRCLRAPGATCHTNLDCAPSKLITDETKSINTTAYSSTMNEYELKFWQETLVCSQETPTTSESYDASNNRCCREIGNTITVATDESIINNGVGSANRIGQIVDTTSIPGVNIALDDNKRYSRNITSHYNKQTASSTFPAMETAVSNACTSGGCATARPTYQYNTLNDTAARTCCTGNWVRNFHSSNGGGHKWGPSKLQSFDKTNFRCMNWIPSANNTTAFKCTGSDPNANCSVKSTTSYEAEPIFDWLSTMELTGIPQIAIESEEFSSNNCKIDITNPTIAPGAATPIPGLIDHTQVAEYDVAGEYYSATDMTNFDSGIKQVFSEDELSCCQPLGTQMNSGDDPNLCCSGHINPTNNKCALPNYANLTVYFNRYVSSEAQALSDSEFDPNTGFIKSRSSVHSLACLTQACESGVVAYGLALTSLKIPGHEDKENRITRFLDGNDDANNFSGKASLFDDGLKWNTNVYCVPQELVDAAADSGEIDVYQCSNN